MKKIGLIGFGVLGRQIKNHLEDNLVEELSFLVFDDNYFKEEKKNAYPFNYYQTINEEVYFIVCLGYYHLKLKKKIINQLKSQKKKMLTFIHPSSVVNKRTKVGEGVIIYPNCCIDMNTQISDGVLLNNSVTISHDNQIKDCCFLSAGVTTAGRVTIKECTFIGANSAIANEVIIGKNCRIGIGSVITKNLPDNTSGVGNPFIQRRLLL